MSNYFGVIITLLIGQTTWLVVQVPKYIPVVTTVPCTLGYVSYVSILILFALVLPSGQDGDKNKPKRGVLYYFCCLFAWCSAIDFIFYLEIMEVVKGFIGFYLVTGEPYLGTSYGTIALLWDTTGNLAMYLVIIYQIDNKLDHRNSVLYFGGTLVTSLCCLLVGGVTGNHGSNLYESSFLNIPYVIIPTYYLLDAFCQPRKFPKSLPSKETSDYKMLDIVLCIGLLLSCIFGLVRGIAALGSPMPLAAMYRTEFEPYLLDPSKFGVVWILFLMGVGGMLQVSIAFGLWRSGSRWVMDLSIIYAAVVIHGTFTHLIPQFCVGVSPEYHISPESMLWVVAGNLFVPVVAVAVVMRCFAEPGYFKPTNQKLE